MKVNMYNFDKIDVKIVNLLLEDGRMPASEIARQLGDISERAVRYRIDRMVTDGIIHIRALQQAGKRMMKTEEFLRGFRLNSDWKTG